MIIKVFSINIIKMKNFFKMIRLYSYFKKEIIYYIMNNMSIEKNETIN